MQPVEHLGAGHLCSVVMAYRDVLRAHQEVLNRLNVYPVPDGDTGTNMALTVEAVVSELAHLSPPAGPDMATVCKAISHGSLMGARGNSGVILSQVLRGMTDAFKGLDAGDADTLARALRLASDGAYAAVMRPTEGTILTVVRASAEAVENGKRPSSLSGVLELAREAAAYALERTPDLLPVLKQAGVVDAGGAGFVLLLDSFLNVVDGRPLPDAPVLSGASTGLTAPVGGRRTAPVHGGPSAPVHGGPSAPAHDPVGDLRYEVMYFLEAPDETIPALRHVWAGIGDSIVVVGGDGLWNCHIHTDDIGAAVEAALDCGRPRQIRVTDLFEQVEEERWVRDATAAGPGEEPSGSVAAVTTAVVAVATGDGIGRIFHSLGVQRIVAGGQSMNPSTARLLEAVESIPADQVVILPNNKNIIAVAEQVDGLTPKSVRVVPTHSIAEGFAALLEYDPEAGADDNAERMLEASMRVTAGEITRAVRSSTCPAGPIAEGDYLGLSRSGIEVVSSVLADAVTGLLSKLVSDEHEIVTIIEGDGSSPATTRHVTEWLGEHRPGISAEVHHGGQPLYPYLLSIE
jgi:DAK2 domain fusion protein YloV